MTPQPRQTSARQWCIVVRADNRHDFEVWGPYDHDEADAVYTRLIERGDIRGDPGRINYEPMSTDWDAENDDA